MNIRRHRDRHGSKILDPTRAVDDSTQSNPLTLFSESDPIRLIATRIFDLLKSAASKKTGCTVKSE